MLSKIILDIRNGSLIIEDLIYIMIRNPDLDQWVYFTGSFDDANIAFDFLEKEGFFVGRTFNNGVYSIKFMVE